ncbi:MAG: hypothetical protein OXN89_12790 [Bryobacterales bacterium]|nr:hypothetical protein [Bryobacterales bacterium]
MATAIAPLFPRCEAPHPADTRDSAVPGQGIGELTVTNLTKWRTFAPALVAVGEGAPSPVRLEERGESGITPVGSTPTVPTALPR